jgi:hypothetical protein
VDAVESRDTAAAAAVAERHIRELYETVFVSPGEWTAGGAARPPAPGAR